MFTFGGINDNFLCTVSNLPKILGKGQTTPPLLNARLLSHFFGGQSSHMAVLVPVLQILLGDSIVVRHTKVFKPSPINTVRRLSNFQFHRELSE